MTNYERFNKDEYLTKELNNNLKNCIGRSTVTVYNAIYDGSPCYAVYHYNALIAIYINDYNGFVMNRHYYSYSASTSRVRNEFIRLFSYFVSVPATRTLDKITRTGEVLQFNNLEYIVREVENERRY